MIRHHLSFPTSKLRQFHRHSIAGDIDQRPSSCRLRVVWVNLGIGGFSLVPISTHTQKLQSHTYTSLSCSFCLISSGEGGNLAAWNHRVSRESIDLNGANGNYRHLDCNHTVENPCQRPHHASFWVADLYARADPRTDREPKLKSLKLNLLKRTKLTKSIILDTCDSIRFGGSRLWRSSADSRRNLSDFLLTIWNIDSVKIRSVACNERQKEWFLFWQ